LHHISEKSRISAPTIFLVAAAFASDVIRCSAQLLVTTVQQPVTVVLTLILFDGDIQIGWRALVLNRSQGWRAPSAQAEPRPYRAARSLAAGPGRGQPRGPHRSDQTSSMTKDRVQRLVVGLVVILFVASALGYLLVPSAMLGIVGIDSNPQVTFLVRTLVAALLALSPGAWAARRRDGTSGQRSVLIGLAGYMFASSLVDLYGFINQVVGIASVPSIALRVILGAVLVWLIPARNGLHP
jgi:hypothetical protein